MQIPLEEWKWLVSEKARPFLDELASGLQDSAKLFAVWRKHLTSDRVSLLAMQARLSRIAERKVRAPIRWLWTEKLLEQASDWVSAKWLASVVPEEELVHDICCGAGVDAVAMAAEKRACLHAVDCDPVACLLAGYHLEQVGASRVEIEQGLAESVKLEPRGWLHVDPDRRANGMRTTQLHQYEPGLEWMEHWVRTQPAGSIKLAPGSETPRHWQEFGGIEWVAVGRTVRQQRIWWGTERRMAGSRQVTLLPEAVGLPEAESGKAHEWVVSDREWSQGYELPCEDWSDLEWIGDAHPVIRASDTGLNLANRLGASVVGDRFGYLVSASPRPSPWVDWFQVLERFPMDVKRLRRALRERQIGILEIKKRGIEIDPERMRMELKLRGDRAATLLLVRDGKKRVALLAKRYAMPTSGSAEEMGGSD